MWLVSCACLVVWLRVFTGTPFSGDSAHDLCGQLMVLKASPYCFPAVFNNRFLGPFRSRSIKQHNGFEHFLVSFAIVCFAVALLATGFNGVLDGVQRFWAKNSIRNSKVSVADELLLPPRFVFVSSAVEPPLRLSQHSGLCLSVYVAER